MGFSISLLYARTRKRVHQYALGGQVGCIVFYYYLISCLSRGDDMNVFSLFVADVLFLRFCLAAPTDP